MNTRYYEEQNQSSDGDFSTKTMTITKAFAEAAVNPKSTEYQLLKQFQQDFPDLKIVRKTHRTPAKYHAKSGEVYNCNQYKNLSYENMERFINALPEGESKTKVIDAYTFLRYGAGEVQTNAYKTVREWFVQQFPLYRKNPLFYLENEVKPIDLKQFQSEKESAVAA